MQETKMFNQLMRLPEVISFTGRCRTSIYDDMSKGRFPQAVKIGPRAVAWRFSQVASWVKECSPSNGGV